ncbi:MAG: VPLPA-CTERM sorting domain-containing protein [Tateyamaria sp.]|uniref:VPLPA-CTERM sorting domain-containing protein n=1 Tax=Tateyamaria sp. TaxID=1929288 RepID=UPI00329E73CF
MTLKSLAAAACISLASATMAFAASVNVEFSFSGASGTFYGLDDTAGEDNATSFDLFMGSAAWTNVDTSLAIINSFLFDATGLIAFDFYMGFTDLPSDLGNDLLRSFAFNNDFGYAVATVRREDSSAPHFSVVPVSAVPLPAGGLFLLTGFGAVAALKRRKKRAA